MSAILSVRLRRWWNQSSRASKSAPRVSLGLETLETRAVPSNVPPGSALASDNQVFLATVYQGELHRPIDSSGLASWGSQLDQNVSRPAVVGAILNSDEFFNREVSTDYDVLLGRAPDPSGLQSFVQARENGATPQEVQARIMGSDEFFARVSGDLSAFLQQYGGSVRQPGSVAETELTAYRFLNAVYGEVLNRSVDATGLAGWSPRAGDAAGRTEIVREVEASPEATRLAVSTIYQDTLGRAPDASGLAYWAGQLQQGVSKSTVLAAILGSNEFFSRMQSYTRQISTSDPNVAAAQFISEAQLFKSQPTLVPAAPPAVFVGTGGDNSGYDVPAGDSTGDVFGIDNSGGNTVFGDNSATLASVIDTTGIDNSTTGSTDGSPSDGSPSDCSCDTGALDTTDDNGM